VQFSPLVKHWPVAHMPCGFTLYGPHMSRVVRREGNDLHEMCGKREATGQDAAAENLQGEGGVN
jgi:hypothetical protein